MTPKQASGKAVQPSISCLPCMQPLKNTTFKNTKLYVAFIDFKKAYDTVNCDILWMVLYRSGVRGKMFRMIRDIYATVQAGVMSKSGLSDFFECFQGLKQGCILGPVLFSMLINELANEILEKSKHRLSLGPAEI